MKVYIATKFENTEGFEALRILLKEAGHEVSLDWTTHARDGRTGSDLFWFNQRCALDDARGVLNSDAVIMLPVDEDTPMAGAFTEIGIAFASQKKCIIVDGLSDKKQHNIFYWLPSMVHVKTLQEAIAALD